MNAAPAGASEASARTYRALLRVPGFPPLLLGTTAVRTALNMLQVALVLFVLREYHSPALAGLASFLWIFPALLVSPIAGALLDRHGRVRLIVLDYAVQVVAFCVLGGLSLAGRLPAPVLLVIVGVAALTGTLSTTGARSLFPLLVPEPLWERANALDSQGYVVATLIGPPIAGALVGLVGGAWALIASTALVAAAALCIWRVPDPPTPAPVGSLAANAVAGVRYVLLSPTLRGIAATTSVLNIGWGIVLIGLPVLVLDRLHQPPVMVGAAYAVSGVTGVVAGLLAGRMRTAGRERRMMAAALGIQIAGMVLLPWAAALWVVLLACALIGVSAGPFDIAIFTLRQRRTDPAWYGRAFAVSMSLNYAGVPIGSALGGPLVAATLAGGLWLATLLTMASLPLPFLVIPAEEPVAGRD